MKKIFLYCLIAGIATNLFGGTNRVALDKLQQQLKQNQLAMYQLRIKLIKSNKDIKALHDRIMVLHRELAMKINEKKAMQKLIQKQTELQNQIIAAKKLQAKKKKVVKKKKDKKQ